jgi:hypothetical protein
MTMFELPDERTVLNVEEVERTEDSGNAAGAIFVVKGLIGRQHHGRVVDAEDQAEIVLEILFPGVPGLAEIGLDLVLDGVRAAEAGG